MTKNNKTTLFIVDKDVLFLKEFKAQFESQTRYEVHTFLTGQECLSNLNLLPDIIFLGVDLNKTDTVADSGFQLLVKLKTLNPSLHVIMLSAHDQLSEVIDCQKHEAYDHLVKNETLFNRSLHIIARLYQQRAVENKLTRFKKITSWLLALLIILLAILPILVYIFSPAN